MCGIAGALHPGGVLPDRNLLEAALLRMAHRGPDGQSVDIGPTWCLGHRRLAVFDTLARGAQPMRRGDCTVVFNGAIYNTLYASLRVSRSGFYLFTLPRRAGSLFFLDFDKKNAIPGLAMWKGDDCKEPDTSR